MFTSGGLGPMSSEATAFEGADGEISADRRALQRLVVDHFGRLVLNPQEGAPAEASQVAAWALRSIAERVEKALVPVANAWNEAHELLPLLNVEFKQ